MRNQNLQSQLNDIDFVRNNCAVANSDLKCQAHWSQHLCVMVAGFLENALDEVYRDYLEGTDRRSVSLRRILTPQQEDFVARATRLNQPWVNELRDFMSYEGRGAAIDTIMRQRNLIAHGRASNITMAQIAEYLPKCVAVVEFLEDKLLRQSPARP